MPSADRAMLAHLVGRAGAASGKSWRAIAAEMGVSTDFLQDVREGRCIPSDVRAATGTVVCIGVSR